MANVPSKRQNHFWSKIICITQKNFQVVSQTLLRNKVNKIVKEKSQFVKKSNYIPLISHSLVMQGHEYITQ